MVKEIERVGIPYHLVDPNLGEEGDKKLRKSIVMKALKALQIEVL